METANDIDLIKLQVEELHYYEINIRKSFLHTEIGNKIW